jgi:Cof subfamily protein (haloacid dehalogenase superfamily)
VTRSRLILLDVDGTLLDDGVIAPSVREAISGARRNGHLVLVATGRSRPEIPQQVLDLGFDGVVSAAGGFVELGDEVVSRRTMPADAVEEIVAFFEAERIEFTLQSHDAVFTSGGLAARVAELHARRGDEVEPVVETPRGPVPTEGIAKATFFGDHPGTFAVVRDGLGERFHVITGTIPYLGEAGGEVSMPGVDKGSALVALAELLERPIGDTVAIGDSSNDVEMIAAAGLGIAMGNASEEVLAIADEVTTSVQEDGVWTAFRRHGLI